MLRIRLSRVGRKHDPSYRMIVTERGRGPQTGDYVEQVGTYDARTDEHELKSDRITHWLSVGAQPSDTVHNLLVKANILDADTVNPLPKKTPIVSESEEDEAQEEDSSDEETEDEAGDTEDEQPEEANESDTESADESEEEKPEESASEAEDEDQDDDEESSDES